MASRTHGGDGAGPVSGSCSCGSTSGLGGAGGGGGGGADDDDGGAALVGAGGGCVVVGAEPASWSPGLRSWSAGRRRAGRPAAPSGAAGRPSSVAAGSRRAATTIDEVRRGRRRRRHDRVGRCGRREQCGDDADRNGWDGEHASPSRRRVRVTFDMCDLQRQPLRASSGTPRRRPLARASRRSSRGGGELPGPTIEGPPPCGLARRGRLDLPSHKHQRP